MRPPAGPFVKMVKTRLVKMVKIFSEGPLVKMMTRPLVKMGSDVRAVKIPSKFVKMGSDLRAVKIPSK